MQRRRCRIERPLLDHRRECRELLTIELHISDTNGYEESLVVLIHLLSLTSRP
jgi:hypothetical protein